jgi:DUF2946 family protein
VPRRSALPALFAVLLQAFAPLLAGAAPGAAIDHVEICTAQGVVQVAVDTGGAPSPSGAPEHCPACATHGAITASAVATPSAPPACTAAATSEHPPVVPAPTRTASRPRAPPPSS